LRALGAGPESRVGLYLERSTELIVGMVGIIQAGAAYVPLAPGYRDERLAFLVEDAGLAAVVVEERTERIPTAIQIGVGEGLAPPREGRERGPGGEGLAYILYTSGSTGTPKGVEVPQRAVARLVLGTDYVQLGPRDRVAQAANASFDAITFEVWGALLTGGALVGVEKEA